jgi:hypothetical protein
LKYGWKHHVVSENSICDIMNLENAQFICFNKDRQRMLGILLVLATMHAPWARSHLHSAKPCISHASFTACFGEITAENRRTMCDKK